MSRMRYNYRIQATFRFDEKQVYAPATHPQLMRFTEVLWYGLDDEGYCVFKRDVSTGEIVRIDFLPPY
ncbi:MAG: hypothetical protein ACTSQE_10210 [Candidatus Heimdallarchaeaceae archaeon]